MSELSQKLHYKLNGTTDEITLYSTLGEVNNKGLNVKVDGINAYAGYGTEADGEVSRMNYKPPAEEAQKILKNIALGPKVTIIAKRNDETVMQNLTVMQCNIGDTFYMGDDNAPAISGYDFVLAMPNNFVVTSDITVSVYYVPSNVPDRTIISWNTYYLPYTPTGDMSKTDYINTYAATSMQNLFYNKTDLVKAPKINTSNLRTGTNLFYQCLYMEEIFPIDTKKTTSLSYMFWQCASLDFTKNGANVFDLSSANTITNMFGYCYGITADKPVHLKNVPSALDLSVIGTTNYIVDNYI